MTTLQQALEEVSILCGDTPPLSTASLERLRLAFRASYLMVQNAARWSFLFQDVVVSDENWDAALDIGFVKPASWGQVVAMTYNNCRVARILPREFTRSYKAGVAGSSGMPRAWCPYSNGAVGVYPLPADRTLLRVFTQVVIDVSDYTLETVLPDALPFWFVELVKTKTAAVYAGRHISNEVQNTFNLEYEQLLSRYAISHSRMHPTQGTAYGSTI